MSDFQKQSIDYLIGRGLITAETVAAELRSRLINRIAKSRLHFNAVQLLRLARDTLAEFEPLLAQTLFDSEVAAWISGVDFVAKKLPPWAEKQIALIGSGSSGRPPRSITTIFYPPDGDEPFVRFPMIERAAERLANKQVMPREEFDRLAAEVKHQAFTVAHVDSIETLTQIRDTLVDLVAEGPSLREFKARLGKSIETSRIGPAHLELIYRNNVMTAYSQGHDELAQNPVVQAVFPYQAYLAINDSRVRPDHLALMKLGLNGTNIFRSDDPFWSIFTPPISWNCRCGVNLLTIEAAARKGVREAQDWQKSGKEPQFPEWRIQDIPFRPPAGWATRPRLRAA